MLRLKLISSATLPRFLLNLPHPRPFASSAPARPRIAASSPPRRPTRPPPRRVVDEDLTDPKPGGRLPSRRPKAAGQRFADGGRNDSLDEDLDPEQEYWERYLAACEPHFGDGKHDEGDCGNERNVDDRRQQRRSPGDRRYGGRTYSAAEDEEDDEEKWVIQDEESEDKEEDDSKDLGYARMRAGKFPSQLIDTMKSDESFSHSKHHAANAHALEAEGDESDESEAEWDDRQWQQGKDGPGDADHEESLDSGSELSDMISDDEQEKAAGSRAKFDSARAQMEENQGRMAFDPSEARTALFGQWKSGTRPFDEKISGKSPRENSKEVMSKDYIVSKARLHARLWRQELQKHGGGAEDGDRWLQEEDRHQSLSHSHLASGNKDISLHHGEDNTVWSSKMKYENMSEDWEGFMGGEEHINEGISPREQQMVLEELQRRMEFNRRHITAFVKNHIFSRHRPIEGWNNIIEALRSRSKRVRAGRLATSSDDACRPLNDLETVIERQTTQTRQRRF